MIIVLLHVFLSPYSFSEKTKGDTYCMKNSISQYSCFVERQALLQSNLKRAVGGSPQLQTGRRENTVTCLSGRDSGGSHTNSCQSPNTCSISCSGWNYRGRLEDTSDMSLLSKHIYFRKEDNWRQLTWGNLLNY